MSGRPGRPARILLTGAGGFVGRHMLVALRAAFPEAVLVGARRHMAEGPLPGAKAYGTGIVKIVILLTDGDNTQNRWTTSSPEIDARTELACTQVKQSGVRLYTIEATGLEVLDLRTPDAQDRVGLTLEDI